MIVLGRYLIRKSRKLYLAIATLVTLLFFLANYPAAYASSDGTFSISPAGGNYATGQNLVLTVYETSTTSDNTNAVQLNLSYSSNLKYVSTSLSGPFTLCAQNTGGNGSVNIACAATTAVSGTQSIAQITFSVLNTGTGTVSFTSGSEIASQNGSYVGNGVLPTASYTLSTPLPPSSTSSGGTKTSNSKTLSSSSQANVSPNQPASAQNASHPPATKLSPLGSLSIRVTDSRGVGLAGCQVTLMPGNRTAITNNDGVANFSGVQSNTYTINVTGKNINTISTKTLLAPGENKIISLTAKKASDITPIIFIFGGLIVAGLGVVAFRLIKGRHSAYNPSAHTQIPSLDINKTLSSSPDINSSINQSVPPPSTIISPVTPNREQSYQIQDNQFKVH